MTYAEKLRPLVDPSILVLDTESRFQSVDGTTTMSATISCERGPHALTFTPKGTVEEDAKTISDWWEEKAQYPLIVPAQ